MQCCKSFVVFGVCPVDQSIFEIGVGYLFVLSLFSEKVEIVFVVIPHMVDVLTENFEGLLVGSLVEGGVVFIIKNLSEISVGFVPEKAFNFVGFPVTKNKLLLISELGH